MAIKIKSVKINPIDLGNGANGKALGYFRKYSLISTNENANTLKELMSGLEIHVDLNSLEVPDEDNQWLYYEQDGSYAPMPESLKQELIGKYKKYLNFTLDLKNPTIDERSNILFPQNNENEISFNYAKNYGEDDPLMVWKEVDIRDLDGLEISKSDEWRNYDRDENGECLGLEQYWDEKHGRNPDFDPEALWPHKGPKNYINGFLPGYMINFSFICELEGEILEDE
ncbi:MAG: hypothetical protein MUC49_00685 [Raineya sp.]|jgi:hypothetical protein|nr:hypothetical protein [Raineya sp.]